MDMLHQSWKGGSAYEMLQNSTHYDLRMNGKCLDKIKQGQSELSGLGNGAFAQRDIKKGELIIPALLYAIDKSELMIPTETGVTYNPLVNYCFGHDESSVLLCHVTPAALINHKSCPVDSKNGKCENGPNADYKWSEWNFKNRYSRQLSPPSLYEVSFVPIEKHFQNFQFNSFFCPPNAFYRNMVETC